MMVGDVGSVVKLELCENVEEVRMVSDGVMVVNVGGVVKLELCEKVEEVRMVIDCW